MRISDWSSDVCSSDLIEFVKAFSGLDEIVGAVEDLIWPMWESTTHYCANHRVTFDGADRAKGICDVYCIGNLADGPAAHVVASSHDRSEERRVGKEECRTCQYRWWPCP